MNEERNKQERKKEEEEVYPNRNLLQQTFEERKFEKR